MSILTVKDLSVVFDTEAGTLHALDQISFSVDAGKTVCLVGESGCGKSVTSAAIMRILPTPPARITSGTIDLEGKNLLELSPLSMQAVRGGKIGMIFQDPMTSLNPVYSIGFQIAEAVTRHTGVSGKEAEKKVVELLTQVGISDAARRAKEYPHQLSGGMRQRVMIAMALSCEPDLLIADEPTTALDVTVQAQILDLLNDIRKKRNMAMLFITHDLGIVAEIADEVIVLYAGRIAERGTTAEIFNNPSHPYTLGLLGSIPSRHRKGEPLTIIAGTLPDPLNLKPGCRFYDRCERATAVCTEQPAERISEGSHMVACHHPYGSEGVAHG